MALLLLALVALATACDPVPPLPVPPDAPACQGLRPTIVGTDGADRITGTGGRDIIHALGGNDYVNAIGGNDVICGGSGRDELNGGADADLIDGGQDPGNVLIGHAGADIVSYRDWSTSVTVDLFSQVGGSGDRLIEFENVTGSRFADRIIGDHGPNHLNGFGGGDTIFGLSGDDTLLPGGTATQYTHLHPGQGSDFVEGGAAYDVIDHSQAGPVVVDLGAGYSRGEGTDTLINVDWVIGSNYNDTIAGGPGNDRIDAGLGDDVVDGRGGNDTVNGGEGTDRATWATSSNGVIVDLADGSSTGQGTDVLRGIENVTGSRHDDALTGSTGPNVINGSLGVDICVGNGGTDTYVDCP